MATELDTYRTVHMQYREDDDISDVSSEALDEEEEEDVDDDDDGEQEESAKDCKGMLYLYKRRRAGRWSLWQVLDPRAKWVEEWNRIFLFVCGMGLFVDPLFFYTMSISYTCLCLFVDGWFAITVTVLKSMTDALHLWNMWLRLKMAKRTYTVAGGEDGSRLRDTNPRSVALRYLKSKKGFFFDLFVILPIPQITLWVAVPIMMKNGSTTSVISLFLIVFLFQYLPKVCHFVWLLRRMQSQTGYIFGTVWGGIALNLIAYFVASHAAGACWYLLGLQRASQCLLDQCVQVGCAVRALACRPPTYYGDGNPLKDKTRILWAGNKDARKTCLNSGNSYEYGAYQWVVQLVANDSRLEKILFPIFWALMTLSTFGNIASTTDWLETVFNLIALTIGLLLVTMLIGNIKVFLNAITSKKQDMQLRLRNIEWWMRKRRLPQAFRHRVRNYERQRWAAMRGVDESEMLRHFPEGLRRDIKYHLCLDLVRQVPLFQHMDDLVLENICDRVKSVIFTKGETITREGDPVQRMLFVVRGHLQSSQVLRDGVKSCCMLGPGNFSGDELLSWCLRRPFLERLPPSSSTLVTLETTEAFSLEAQDVKYVTQHFRYTFVNEKVKRSARYYSPGWRTWAAVAIQLAWRRYKHRLTLSSLSFIRPRRPLSRGASLGEDRLRIYTAMLTSPKPSQDDFDF